MGIADDIRAEVKEIFKSKWDERDGHVVPEADDLRLGNDAVKLTGTVLYADLAESTEMVNKRSSKFAAEIYKTFLISACRIIRHRDGEITAFDGDRVMAVFIDNSKHTNALKTALNINWVVQSVVNDEMKKQYPNTDHVVRHAVGVDTSDLLVARTGVRGDNDLVWVGRAANYAAKLCTLRTDNYATWITKAVHDGANNDAKYSNGKPMWEERTWTTYNTTIYRSSWYWKPQS